MRGLPRGGVVAKPFGPQQCAASSRHLDEPLPPARPTHKITKTDVVRIGERYGVEGATVHEFPRGKRARDRRAKD
jgi:hypothetical protein